mmetsp:Transcript_17595/g.35230  ORF Transcript_17595/g.35230 Transcript_17595/m.35230 type:complete len:217 (-) Transcript_17595:896-1546(-)
MKAATRYETPLACAVASVSSTPVHMVSSKPLYTMSFSDAPSVISCLTCDTSTPAACSPSKNPRFVLSSQRLFRRPNRTCCRFLSHSKYDADTPPAFMSMSGSTTVPLAISVSSARGVVGPLAPSAMILALILPALVTLMARSKAAGTRMSHSSSMSDAADAASTSRSTPGNPSSEWFSRWCFLSASTSRPLLLYTEPLYSTIPTTLAPNSWKNLAA